MEFEFVSRRQTASSEIEIIHQLMNKGATDGLPVIPPTPERVESFLDTVDLEPDDIIGTVPERKRVIRTEKIAINGVMAGCRPDYMPILIAAVRAVCDPRFSVHGPTATLTGTAIFLALNGPLTDKFNMKSGANLFGPGDRSNATIGRALTLILRNTAGSRPEEFDRACFSHPGRFTFCIAEDEKANDWVPFHVQRSFERGESTLTAFAAESPIQVTNTEQSDAESIAATIATRIANPGSVTLSRWADRDGEIVVLVAGEHRFVFERDGWNKQDLQEYLYEHANPTTADLKRAGINPEPIQPGDENETIAHIHNPESVFVFTAGGDAGPHSCVLTGWAGRNSSAAVTVGIPGHARPTTCEVDISAINGTKEENE